MKLVLTLLASLCAFALVMCASDQLSQKDVAAIATKAKELTSGVASREGKIIALHAFVRDKIAEFPTSYS
jgi:hypothetical protein